MATTYDTREALLLMADAKAKSQDRSGFRAGSAKELFGALVELHDKQGFIVLQKGDYGAEVRAPGRINAPRTITYGLNDGVFTLQNGDSADAIKGLVWDHRSQEWRGPRGPDVDGKPTHRSALAVLMAAVLSLKDDEWRDMHEPAPKEDDEEAAA